MIDLNGKSAVITDGSRGIGRAIVLRLVTQGADVAFSYRGNAAAAEETAAAVRARALAEIMARPDPLNIPLDDVVPGEPTPNQLLGR